jgi:hypothetical protein
MCGDNLSRIPAQSEPQSLTAVEESAGGYTAPAKRLVAHLELTRWLRVAVQDLSSAPDREAT